MKELFIAALCVIAFPVSIILIVGLLSFLMYFITDCGFYAISEHPATWTIAFITTICMYLVAGTVKSLD